MELSEADHVWNRAAMERGGASPRNGDRALTDLLLAHGYIMNGGMSHALDLSVDELSAAVAGFQFFGLSEIVSVLNGLADSTEEEVEKAGEHYCGILPTDQTLFDRFHAKYQQAPEAFAPVEV